MKFGKSRVTAVVIIVMIAVFRLLSVLDTPRVALLHGVDVFNLMVCGFGFGVAFGLLAGKRWWTSE